METIRADTIRDIDEKVWNTLVGCDFVERTHAWYRTVEDSGIRRMHYLFVKENQNLVAAACCFPYNHILYKVKIRFLEVRSPLGISPAFFSRTPQHAQALMRGLEQIQKEEKTKGFLILDLKRSSIENLRGFTCFPMIENTYIDLNFTDFDDYLDSLSRKNRGNIRNTLNKARKKWEIRSLVTNEFSKWKDVACRLQGYTCEKHNDYHLYLTEQFYEALEKNLKDKVELILFFRKEVPLVSGLCLNSPTICQCRAAGVDPRYREYQAYFLMYYEGINRAIERKQKRIYLGTTVYSFKERIGVKKEELLGAVKLKNFALDLGLKSYVAASRTWGKKF